MRYKVILSGGNSKNGLGFAGKGTLNLSDTALIVTGNRPTFGFELPDLSNKLLVPTLRTIPYAAISAYEKRFRWHYLTYKLPDGKRLAFAFRFPDNDGNRFITQLEEYRLALASLYMKNLKAYRHG